MTEMVALLRFPSSETAIDTENVLSHTLRGDVGLK